MVNSFYQYLTNDVENSSSSSNDTNNNNKEKIETPTPEKLGELLQRYYDPKHMGWASPGWIFLHSIADSFPMKPSTEEQEAVKLLFRFCLPKLLPCSICNTHLAEEYLSNIDASSGELLSKWLYTVHNHVNERTAKKVLTMEQCKKEQELLRSIKWESVVADLKINCNRLCMSKMLTSDSTSSVSTNITNFITGSNSANAANAANNVKNDENNKCASIEPFENFRRSVNNNRINSKSSGHNNDKKKEKIMMVIIILLLLTLVTITYYYNNILKNSKFLHGCQKEMLVTRTTRKKIFI
jgi:hypothetical protein